MIHPIQKAVRIGFEARGLNEDSATNDHRLVRVNTCFLWSKVLGMDQVAHPDLVFDDDSVQEDVTQIVFCDGEVIYLSGRYSDFEKRFIQYYDERP